MMYNYPTTRFRLSTFIRERKVVMSEEMIKKIKVFGGGRDVDRQSNTKQGPTV